MNFQRFLPYARKNTGSEGDTMRIRMATEADSARLLAIYAQYMDTAVTFEYALPSEQEFAARIAGVRAQYPYLICEDAGRTLGYAYAHAAWQRAAYQWCVELSIYVDMRERGKGVGTKLYGVLQALLRAQGVKSAYACVAVPNAASEALHARCGFTRAGVYRKAGYKNGAWHDVVWFEKILAEHGENPAPPCPVSALSAAAWEQALRS